MKKMTTVLALIALTLTLSTMAFGQNGKRNQRRTQGGITPPTQQVVKTGSGTLPLARQGAGSSQQRNNASRLASGGASSKSIESFNFGSSGAKASRPSQAGQTKRLAGDFDGDGTVDSSDFLRRNKTAQPSSGSANQNGASANATQRNNAAQRPQSGKNIIMANTEGDFHFSSKPKSNLTATTYGRGSVAKPRGK